MYFPTGVVCDGKFLYIINNYNHCIQKLYISDHKFVYQMDRYWKGNRKFIYFRGITFNDTYFYVSGSQDYRI